MLLVNKSNSLFLKVTSPLLIIYIRRKKEINTRLLLHAHDTPLNYQNITIHTTDTDVFILAITMWVIETRTFIKIGKQNNLRLTDVEKVVNGIDKEYEKSVCEALLGLHAFTYCDTTSGLHGRGKLKALQETLKLDSVETWATWTRKGSIARAI